MAVIYYTVPVGPPIPVSPTDPMPTADQTLHAGEKRPTDTINGYRDERTVADATVLGNTGTNIIGGSLIANDTQLLGLLIPVAATATVVQITGFVDDNGRPLGSVASLTLDTAGVGYTSVPTVTIAASPTGETATAVAAVDTTAGTVTSLTLTAPGAGYLSAPAVTITGGGATTAATASVTIVPPLTLTGSTTVDIEQMVGVALPNAGGKLAATPSAIGVVALTRIA